MARSREAALKAAETVKVTYKNHKKPILTIAEALKYPNHGDKVKEHDEEERDLKVEEYPEDAIVQGDDLEQVLTIDAVKTISGEFEIGAQHHFHLETQSCIVRPLEDNQYQIDCATQWIAGVQSVVARALDIQHNALDIRVSILFHTLRIS